MSQLPNIESLKVKGKKVLLRLDLNVPMSHGKISDVSRIERAIPTVKELIKRGAKTIICSHFGRPEGQFVRSMSLAPIADALSAALDGKEVKFAVDCVGHLAEEAAKELKEGEVLLLENLRFHKGEEKNDKEFAAALAGLADVYVNDAFSCSHRSHASITGVAEILPSAAGFLIEEEVKNLENILSNPEKPVMAIVGGSKVSTKLELLETLINKVDFLVIGGGMANTFLAAQKVNVGKSLFEKDLIKTAANILEKAEKQNCEIILPSDGIAASSFDAKECASYRIENLPNDKMILDIGHLTVRKICTAMEKCKTVIWNGPLGVYEKDQYLAGSAGVARIIDLLTREKKIKSVAGGGDVNACLEKCGLTEGLTYVSTAGGAFLEWLEGKELPGIAILKENSLKKKAS